MLYEIMRHIRNYFATKIQRTDSFTIEDGTISLDFISEGQYFLIEGSISNDGVYLYPATKLVNETFDGTITVLAPPKAFLDLAAEIESYQSDNKPTGLQSESFGGYSYSRASGKNGGVAGWQDVFSTRLNAWRKL